MRYASGYWAWRIYCKFAGRQHTVTACSLLAAMYLALQVRRRWKNCLNADNKQGGWTPEVSEQVLLLVLPSKPCQESDATEGTHCNATL